MTTFQYSDGGRADAGYKGQTRDCVVRALAIATGEPYQSVYDEINGLCKTERGRKRSGGARLGVWRKTYEKFLFKRGWKWTPTMGIGTGCTVHLKAEQLPVGTIICKLSRHLVTVIDGIIHDNHDCSRGGLRCVYGFFSRF